MKQISSAFPLSSVLFSLSALSSVLFPPVHLSSFLCPLSALSSVLFYLSSFLRPLSALLCPPSSVCPPLSALRFWLFHCRHSSLTNPALIVPCHVCQADPTSALIFQDPAVTLCGPVRLIFQDPTLCGPVCLIVQDPALCGPVRLIVQDPALCGPVRRAPRVRRCPSPGSFCAPRRSRVSSRRTFNLKISSPCIWFFFFF